MFTRSYAEKAERLIASCQKFNLPYVLHETPEVHRSISPYGGEDLAYTKPNFIRWLLSSHKMPILYVDCDCEFDAEPVLVDQLVESRVDFAIYNWYADSYTDRFSPLPTEQSPESKSQPRFYQFAGSIDLFGTDQLGCSGLVQFYARSLPARALLAKWHEAIIRLPHCADDAVLTFTYNNLGKYSWLRRALKTYWLPKAYARISYWIYEQPVIDHPDPYVPDAARKAFAKLEDPGGRKPVYKSRLERRTPSDPAIPRDCVIDVEQRMLCRVADGQLAPFAEAPGRFWIGRSRTRTLVERLGFPADTRLLILHADDLGMHESINAAFFELLRARADVSGSAMAPCPAFSALADFARAHPCTDLGLHLTLTSDSSQQKWRPISDPAKIPSLVDEDGFLQPAPPPDAMFEAAEAATELRAQIELALSLGMRPSHLDAHQFFLQFRGIELFAALLDAARDFGLPVLVARNWFIKYPYLQFALAKDDLAVDRVMTIGACVGADKWPAWYSNALLALKPGVTELLIHPGIADAGLVAWFAGRQEWGAAWRQRDFDHSSSREFWRSIADLDIQLITWTEMAKRLL